MSYNMEYVGDMQYKKYNNTWTLFNNINNIAVIILLHYTIWVLIV